VLVTTSERLAAEVLVELRSQAQALPRVAVIEQSLARYGAVLVVPDIDEACAIVNELAPEHLEIVCRDEEQVASRIRHAGAIFFGDQTPEAVGDYLAGPNHVLPTSGAARFSSALGVSDFLKKTSILKFTPNELNQTAGLIAILARAEGLEAHARSVLLRREEKN